MEKSVARGYFVTNRISSFICPKCGCVRSASVRKGFGSICKAPCGCGRKNNIVVRRKSLRKNLSLFGSIDGGKKGGIIINDISRDGANISIIKSPSILCVGEEIFICIFYGTEEMKVRSIVRNVRADFSVGLEFVDFRKYPEENEMHILSIMNHRGNAVSC
jgi:hypothetical protein